MIIFIYTISFLLAVCLGSFLNALEWRIKNKISLLAPRSQCPKCGQQLKWFENIPLISFIFLKGKCSGCKQRISIQYPLVELWLGLVGIFLLYFYNFDLFLIARDFFIIFILTFVFIYDFKYMEVLDSFTLLPAVALYLLMLLTTPAWWLNLLMGAIIGGGFFLLQFVLSKGKWVGGGDIRIGVLLGVILGFKLLILALWIAYVLGAIVSVILVLKKKKQMQSPVPFGVFLTLATVVVMFWGGGILEWYFGLF